MAHKHDTNLALQAFPTEKRVAIKHPFNIPVYDEHFGYIEVEPRKLYRIGSAEDVMASTPQERGEMFYQQLMTDCFNSINKDSGCTLH